MIRFAPASLLLLAACQREEAPADRAAPAAPPQPRAESDVGAAERLVRQRIGAGGDVHFSGARRSASEGVSIVCGAYEQGGANHRYIVVNREEAFVEPRMRAGEMDRAFAEFCREGGDNGPPRQLPVPQETRR